MEFETGMRIIALENAVVELQKKVFPEKFREVKK